jgi:hypothetical protein
MTCAAQQHVHLIAWVQQVRDRILDDEDDVAQYLCVPR